MNEDQIRKIIQEEIQKFVAKQKNESFRTDRLIPTVTGAKSSNAALKSLCTQLAISGIIRDNTTT